MAVPDTAPTVAVTALVKVPVELPAVNTPPWVMVPAAAFAAPGERGGRHHVVVGVCAVTLKVTVPPGARVTVVGATVTVATGPGCTVTDVPASTPPMVA